MRQNLIISLALAAMLTSTNCRAAESLTVFAAASMTNAVEEMISRFSDNETLPQPVRSSFASSSTLARQIEAGAPATIYISASPKWMDYLAQRSLIETSTRRNLASNQLVIIGTSRDQTGSLDISAANPFANRLGSKGRMALGDPAHVPAGIYSRQALQKLGLWEGIADRLALTDNVRGALTLVTRGETPLGIVYATDVSISDDVRELARLPRTAHDPILYPVAIVAGARSPAAEAFLAFITGPDGAAVLGKYGFGEPDPQ